MDVLEKYKKIDDYIKDQKTILEEVGLNFHNSD